MTREENIACYAANEVMREFDISIVHFPCTTGRKITITFNPFPKINFTVYIVDTVFEEESPDYVANLLRTHITKEWYKIIYKEDNYGNA